ncbi:protoporphyrinogen/coproporphyrinogen oxidase [Streptacidiphilus fuscans]|uniref:FAD-dependent oxidoreductase n=1 Tax=Streptacidiphilus fuscans TaxID=2789292 RepID=A0A931B2P3_9ACTN|nr:NAD(P)/FAD-dependent oxidoreductase [Streptacidiphilus fuscans]MBF9069264.1 FAD-dependent oxidoreductase [Streptacidiphilus fuscans]
MAETDIDVAVVGAGISGLATAFHLAAAGRSVRVFEAAARVGGRMASREHDGYVIDEGTETIAARGYESTWRLIRAVGMSSDVISVGGRVAVWRGGRARANQGHPAALLTGGTMSWGGRRAWLRYTAELLSRRREFDQDSPEATPLRDATVAEFARDRHRDLHDYLLQPLAGSLFGWSPERSAIAAMIAPLLAVGGAGARWATYRNGMDRLALALARRLDVVTGSAAVAVKPEPGGVRLDLTHGRTVTARRVVLAVPAPQALTLHADLPDDERPYLTASTYSSMLKVTCLLDRPLPSPTRRPSYCMQVPAVENEVFAGAVLDHIKAPDRAPSGRGLVNLFASPAATRRLLRQPDEEVVAEICRHAERFLPGLTDATHTTFVVRWPIGLPEATPEALRLRRAFLDRPVRRVDYAGDWVALRPSSEGAVRSGEIVAGRILSADAR